jgi:hypothetical protein
MPELDRGGTRLPTPMATVPAKNGTNRVFGKILRILANGPSESPEHPDHWHTPRIGVRSADRYGLSRGCPGKNGRGDCASRLRLWLSPRSDRSSLSPSPEKTPVPARGAGMAAQRTVFENSLICARFRRDRFRGRLNQAATATTAHLTTLAACCPRFIRCPLVRCTFFMRSTPAFARDLTLLFW